MYYWIFTLFFHAIKFAVFIGNILWFSTALFAEDLKESIKSPVRLFVHGEADWALLGDDGILRGPIVDSYVCIMEKLGLPYMIGVVPLSRAGRLWEEGGMDLWYPIYDDGTPGRDKLIVPYSSIDLYWFIRPGFDLQPGSEAFKKHAKVTAFPSSGPERYLKAGGYHLMEATDDENIIMLMLMEGRIDAILSADFRSILKPRTQKLAKKLRVVHYKTYGSGFEISSAFQKTHPAFKAAFKKALVGCK